MRQINLIDYQTKKLWREKNYINIRHHAQISIRSKTLVNFCSNDYLAIGMDKRVQEAFAKGIKLYGFGSGSSALLSGYYKTQRILEERFAEFLNRDDAILFNSGYHANLGVIAALGKYHTGIIADKYCHASIIDGIRLTRLPHFRYLHNSPDHAALLFNKVKEHFIFISEGVFSMEGDLCLLQKFVRLNVNQKGLYIVDDAHGIGVLGKKGGGICELHQLHQKDIHLLTIPLGKAFGGLGAIVAGSKDLIKYLYQTARTLHYTTALPPAITHTLLTSLNIMQQEDWRRERLLDLIQYFLCLAEKVKLPLISKDLTPIKCVLINNNIRASKIQHQLKKLGYYVALIRPPTVPKARLRITLTIEHQKKDIMRLIEILAKLLTVYE